MSGGPTRALRILVAEDDHDMAITLMMLLGEDGHEARTVHSGRNVIGSVADFDPDVVLLDIGLPDQDGFTTCRQLHADQPDLVVVLCSIRDADEYGDAVESSSAAGFLSKSGLSAEALSRIVTSATEGPPGTR
jgi:DNA-binding response OmpR family regulator